MKDKIRYFGENTTPFPVPSRGFPSDSLRRLHDKKAVPSLIKQFSNSAPLAQMEVWKLVNSTPVAGCSKVGLCYPSDSDFFQRCKNAQKALKL